MLKLREGDIMLKYKSKEEVIAAAASFISENLKESRLEMNYSRKVKDYFMCRLHNLEHEEFHVMYLDSQHRMISCDMEFKGTIDGASVYPREIVKSALKHNAAAVILCHNHPSGISVESSADIQITKMLKRALELIDVRVLDHLIVGNDVMSFAEKGIL